MSTAAISSAASLARRAPSPMWVPLRAWHLLSLDAPTVAMVWALCLNGAAEAHHRWVETLALGLAVWFLYVSDRLLDAARRNFPLRERHHFHARHRSPLIVCMACAVLPLAALVMMLPAQLRTDWLLLSLPLFVYAAGIHMIPVPRLPKELAVSLFFAVATAMPSFAAGMFHLSTAMETVLFGAICWLNCVAIARWECVPGATMSASTRFGVRHLKSLCGAVIGVSMLALAASEVLPVAACALSALLLLFLDSRGRRLGSVEMRGLADVVLLTPLLLWPVLR